MKKNSILLWKYTKKKEVPVVIIIPIPPRPFDNGMKFR